MVITCSLGELMEDKILQYYWIVLNINDRVVIYIYIYIYIYISLWYPIAQNVNKRELIYMRYKSWTDIYRRNGWAVRLSCLA